MAELVSRWKQAVHALWKMVTSCCLLSASLSSLE